MIFIAKILSQIILLFTFLTKNGNGRLIMTVRVMRTISNAIEKELHKCFPCLSTWEYHNSSNSPLGTSVS
jgi:hypothetical protein